MKKIKQNFYKIILFILFILISYVTYCSIFNIYSPREDFKPIVIILGMIVMIFTLISLKKLIDKVKLKEKNVNIIAIILCIIFFIILSIFGKNMNSIPTYDLTHIQTEAMTMLENGGKFVNEEYFAQCTNNVPVTIMIYYIYKIGHVLGISNIKFFAIVINCLFIAITAFFTYLSVSKVKGFKLGIITLIFFILNPIFYMYASYYYTYTLCMPFAAIGVYLYILAKQTDKNKKAIMLLICSGILISLGFIIRVVIGIILIAILISIIITDKFNKNSIFKILSLGLGFIIGIVIYVIICFPIDIIENKDLELPVTHYIMYSLNEENDGRWNKEDFNYTYKEKTYQNKIDANIAMIKERLNKLGLKGWIELSKTKLSVNWSNGDYGYVSKLTNVEDITKIYEYVSGNQKIFILYYAQICKAVTLFLMMIAVFKEIVRKDKNNNLNVMYISIFGAFLFYLFWEVAPSYGLTFIPWMMLLISVGISEIDKLMDLRKIKLIYSKEKNILFSMHKIKKYLGIMTITCTGVLLLINYYEYAIKEKEYYDKRVIQYAECDSLLAQIADKKVEQTFKTDKPFNSIAIKFYKEGVSKTTHYNLT